MSFCTSCGGKVDEGKRFCKHCGQEIDVETDADQPNELVDKRAFFLQEMENMQSKGTCAYCLSRKPMDVCGAAQGPHFGSKIEPTNTCTFFAENPAQLDYARAMFLDSYAKKVGIDAHDVVRAFEKAIGGGLPQDDETHARFCVAKVLTFWINGQNPDIQTRRRLPETSKAIQQYEAALTLDKEGRFGYFEDERHRFMLSQLDLMYALEGAFESIDKSQGSVTSDEAAIAYWERKTPLCDYLSTNPLITTFVQMGYSYSRLGNKQAASKCFRRALAAAPVNIADQHEHETDQRNEARAALEQLEGEANSGSTDSTGQNTSQAPLTSSGGLRSRKVLIAFAVIAILVVAALFGRFWRRMSTNENNPAVDIETLSPLCQTSATCGYIDATGKIIIPQQYRYAAPFYEGRARVKAANGKYGFLDTNGNMVIAARFDDAANFHEGLARVTIAGKSGFIDKKGAWRIQPTISEGPAALPRGVDDFSDGLAFISELDGRQGWINGWINTSGKLVLRAPSEAGNYWMSASGNFSDGLTVFVLNPKEGFAPNTYGYINKSGEIVIPAKFSDADPFKKGLAAVAMGNLQNWKWGYINTAGKMVIDFRFSYAGQFSEGLASVGLSSKCGYIDKGGTIVIQPQYDTCGDFAEGLAVIRQGPKWGFIDKQGKIRIAPQFRDASSFRAGVAAVEFESGYGYIDKSGKLVARSKVQIPPF